MIKVVVNPPYDAVGVRNTVEEPPQYFSKDSEPFEVTEAEFKRLTDTTRMVDGPAVRRVGDDPPENAGEAEVLTPGKNPTDVPTDPSEPHPSVEAEAAAAAPVRGNPFEEGSNAWALYEGNTAPSLQKLASDRKIEVSSSATKADVAKALDDAGVKASEPA